MAVFKCKMCGGDLALVEGSNVCECEFCGSTQTVPCVDDEKKLTLFNRANRLRFNCEFDKAAGVYESIVAEFPEEAEAYWGLVLCKYGIEYVDDPATAKKVPTCHRSSFDSVLDDKDFELVMEYSDPISRRVYREEAKSFEDIRRSIIEISGKEEPYDLFICYKETDENGERTLDSVLAQDIYDALIGEGYRVFFSRVTLEDKLGQEYEPYIFAALHSAKIMLAVGTGYEYFNAVWVKNEWSRYLKLIASGERKVLIPCFKGIDAYDMPKEFARLQSQDLGKVGAMQDLLRGIEKIIGNKKDKDQTAKDIPQTVAANPSVDSYLKRIQLFLEDHDWERANEYCEKVLDIDPENGKAYIAILLLTLKISSVEQLYALEEPFDGDSAYNKVLRFANDEDRDTIEAANQAIRSRIAEKEELDRIAAERIAAARPVAVKSIRIALGLDPDPDGDAMLAEEEKRHEEVIKHLQEELAIKEEQEVPLLDAVNEEKKEKLRLESARYNNEMSSLENEIERLSKEFASLGIFSGSRKKDIYASIEGLRKKEPGVREKHSNNLATINAETGYKYDAIRKGSKSVKKRIDEELRIHSDKIEEIKVKQFIFGHYSKETNGNPEPIEWVLLDNNNSTALLISKYALDFKPYNTVQENISWGNCTLRRWLNEEFFNGAFTEVEQSVITLNKTSPEKHIEDKVFLLSVGDAKKYFKSNTSRVCPEMSPELNKEAGCMWWLQTPGDRSQTLVSVVDAKGGINTQGVRVDAGRCAVRPVIRISLE